MGVKLILTIDFNALNTHHDNQKMNPIQVHNHIWSPHKPPCHYNHHRLHTKTLKDIFKKTNYLRLIRLNIIWNIPEQSGSEFQLSLHRQFPEPSQIP